jgi:hypothetical protein
VGNIRKKCLLSSGNADWRVCKRVEMSSR